MRFLQSISEAPIGDLKVMGDPEKEGSFRATDLKGMAGPNWAARVHKLFAKAPVTLNVYFFNFAGNKVWFDEDPDYWYDVRSEYMRYAGEFDLERAERLFKGSLPPDYQKGVNILLTQNEGDDRLAMTPWMVGHRIIHALFAKLDDRTVGGNSFPDFQNYIHKLIFELFNHEKAFLLYWKDVCRLIGTTRSSREGTTIRVGEWFVDTGVQFLVEGRVRFNRVTDEDLQGMVAVGLMRNMDLVELDRVNKVIAQFESYMTDVFTMVLRSDVGKFYIL